MSGRIIYTDLDHVLINPVLGPDGNEVIEIIPRPGVKAFLENLGRHGDVWLLTASVRDHAERALEVIGRPARILKGKLTMEDMSGVEDELLSILAAEGLSDDERLERWAGVRAIAAPGVVFDDFEVGSPIYILKSTAVGINQDSWVEVERFSSGLPDHGGLAKAYAEYKRRFLFRLTGSLQ